MSLASNMSSRSTSTLSVLSFPQSSSSFLSSLQSSSSELSSLSFLVLLPTVTCIRGSSRGRDFFNLVEVDVDVSSTCFLFFFSTAVDSLIVTSINSTDTISEEPKIVSKLFLYSNFVHMLSSFFTIY